MKTVFVRKALSLIPSLLALLIAAHFILIHVPGDPVMKFISSPDHLNAASFNEAYQFHAHKLGLHLPDFYFSIHSSALPSVYFSTLAPAEKINIKRMAYQYGNARTTGLFVLTLREAARQAGNTGLKNKLAALLVRYDENQCKNILQTAISESDDQYIRKLNQSFRELIQHPRPFSKYIPVISFHADNRFHRFLFGSSESKGLVRGDFGLSWSTRQPVSVMLFRSIRWTLILSLISLIMALLISVIAGVYSAAGSSPKTEKIISLFLLVLYSLPVFSGGTLLLMTFSNPHVLQWFPSSGIQPTGGFGELSFAEKAIATLPYLTLPLICYTYPSIAFFSRTIRNSMVDILSQDFIRTARAKGLPERSVIWKHAFPNMLFPLITLTALSLPALMSGSVVIETLFSIPGIGLETFHAVQNKDYPVLTGIFTLTGIIALLSLFIADVLYAVSDPRIRH